MAVDNKVDWHSTEEYKEPASIRLHTTLESCPAANSLTLKGDQYGH